MVIVMQLVFVLSIVLASVMLYSNSEMRIASSQMRMETALYVAQGGVERAAAYLAQGGSPPWSSFGSMGTGTYVVAIVPTAMPSDAPQTLDGWISINPGGGGGEFVMRKDDGTMIDDMDLDEDFQGYTGKAVYVHVKPKGNGNQNSLQVNGDSYALNNGNTYDIFASEMAVHIYNDQVNGNGKAKGHWIISLATSCASFIVSN
jgi:hypothetical protein